MNLEVVDQVWWYTSRAAGIIAWLLLSLSMVAGLAQSARLSRNLPAGWTLDLHRFLSLLSIVFLSVHIVALVPDDFVHFGLAELFVPMASEWEPGAVAWGIVGFWLLVAVQVTSLLRSRLRHRVWRVVHVAAFPCWVTATVHLLEAGTDAGHPLFRILQVSVVGVVLTMVVFRVAVRRMRSARPLAVEESVDVDEVHAGKR